METRKLHFRVDGDWLTETVRQKYCFENDQYGAIKIIGTLNGITVNQATRVCEGYAKLVTNKDDTISLVEEPDMHFINRRAMYNRWVRKEQIPQKIKENDELRETFQGTDTFEYDTWDAQNAVSDKLNTKTLSILDFPDPLYDYEREDVPESSAETIRIGEWNVPKNLLDRYADDVVKRYRDLLKYGGGFGAFATNGMDQMADLECERQELHEAICKAVGVAHNSSCNKDQIAFEAALNAYVDEHAGSLVKILNYLHREDEQGA